MKDGERVSGQVRTRFATLEYSTDHQKTWQPAGPHAYVREGGGESWSSFYPHPLPGSAEATDWRVFIHEELEMTEQQHPQPSVGRIVHVVGHNGRCDAAIVTEVTSPTVISVSRHPPRTTPYPQSGVHFNADHKTGDSWHWPEHVE